MTLFEINAKLDELYEKLSEASADDREPIRRDIERLYRLKRLECARQQ